MLLGTGFFQPFPLGYLKFHQIDLAKMEYGKLHHSNQNWGG